MCDLQRDLDGDLQRRHRAGGGTAGAAALLQSRESDLERGGGGASLSGRRLRGGHDLLEALQEDWRQKRRRGFCEFRVHHVGMI